MHRARIRRFVSWMCMAAAALIALAVLLNKATPPWPERYSSVHLASTPRPMEGFGADSVFNAGDAAALESLPGVGPAIAQRIIDLRPILNGYRIPEDLLLVKGIGEKTLEKLMAEYAEPLILLAPMQE